MAKERETRNKELVLEGLDTLFNKRDYAAAERFWSPAYIQHSAHIAPGREGLFDLVKAAPKELHYENALIAADGDYVMLHGRFSGIGQPVGRGRHPAYRKRPARRALGRHPGRGDARVFEERAAHVLGLPA